MCIIFADLEFFLSSMGLSQNNKPDAENSKLNSETGTVFISSCFIFPVVPKHKNQEVFSYKPSSSELIKKINKKKKLIVTLLHGILTSER